MILYDFCLCSVMILKVSVPTSQKTLHIFTANFSPLNVVRKYMFTLETVYIHFRSEISDYILLIEVVHIITTVP